MAGKEIKNVTEEVKKSSVYIGASYSEFDFSLPYNGPSISSARGSGSVIKYGKDGELAILTNAHVVANQSHSYMRLAGDDVNYELKVEYIDHNVDLAICKLKNKEDYKEFIKKAQPIKLAKDMAKDGDEIHTAGFPTGGNTFCTTKGIISRTQRDDYCHREMENVHQQTDSAINGGVSGGIAFNNKGQLIGVPFQGMMFFDNVGYIIPIPIVNKFISECIKAKEDPNYEYKGFPDLAVKIEKLKNLNERKAFGLKKNETGVIITKVAPTSDINETKNKKGLKENDILLSIDDMKINNYGKIKLKTGHKVNFRHYLQTKFIDDIVKFKIFRNKKAFELKIKLTEVAGQHDLIPKTLFETQPSYIFASTICFQKLTTNFLDDGKVTEFEHLESKFKDKKDQEVVVISKILQSMDTIDYRDKSLKIVEKINGKKINNLSDVKKALKNNENDIHSIKLKRVKKSLFVKNYNKKQQRKLLKTYNIKKSKMLFSNDASKLNGVFINSNKSTITNNKKRKRNEKIDNNKKFKTQ